MNRRRSMSTTVSHQGQNPTCSFHMTARLFVRNVVLPDILPMGEVPPYREDEFTPFLISNAHFEMIFINNSS